MRCSPRAALLGALVVFGSLGAGSDASADTWPVARHDAARTGASSGFVPVVEPWVTWRAYMGGRPTGRVVSFGLGAPSVFVAATGGRFIGKHAITQATLWKSDLLGPGEVAALADLDGDGASEVVVKTATRAHVLDGATGSTLWSSPDPEFRAPAGVRVTDLDGDGLPDVFVDECTSCATPGTMTAGAFSFANGFASPNVLWMRPANALPAPSHTGTDAIVDLDGDGLPEVVLSSAAEILVVRGDDGSPIVTLGLPGSDGKPFSQSYAIAAELDGLPGEELVIVQPNGQVGAKVGPPGITAYRVDPQAKTSALLFHREASGYDAQMVALSDVAHDLDGDGISEIVFSHRASASDPFTTEILAGATGATVATFLGARFEGAADLGGAPGAELVIATAEGLSVVHLAQGKLWLDSGPHPGLRAHSMENPGERRLGPLSRRLAVLPRPGQSNALLVGHPSSAAPYEDLGEARSFQDIDALALGPSGLSLVGHHAPLVGEIADVFPADFATRPYPQVAVGTSAGTVTVLGQTLLGTNGFVFWNGKATGSLVGGGMQPSTGAQGGPLVGADDGGPFVVLPGSALGLYVGDARFASLIVPPLPRVLQPGVSAPSVIELDGLGTAVVGVEGHSLVARSSKDGALFGAVDLGPGTPQGTPLPLRVSGGPTRVGIDWRVEGVQIAQSAVDFSTNHLVWQGNPLPFGGFFGSGVGDLDGDGTDTWYSMNDGLNARDADTGALTTTPGSSMWYALPMIAELRSGAGDELLLQAGAAAPRLHDKALGVVWQSPKAEQVNGMAGARVVCGGAPRFITPSVLSPTVRAYQGQTGALVGERVLAGGKVFATTEAAVLAGERPGLLSNATSVAALGLGGPAVLFGSTDGHLYALDACTLDLRFAKFLGASVAEPVVGDTDGDGADEILVGVADGKIHHIDVPACAPPAWVSFGETKDDGDAPHHVSPGESPSFSFAAVPGAKGYEMALIGPDEQALWSPAYRPIAGTSATVDLAGALASRPYRIAVRALGPEGASPDVFSPPLVVVDGADPSLTLSTTVFEPSSIRMALEATDDVALSHFLVQVGEAGAPEEELVVVEEGLFDGAKGEAKVDVTPPSSFFGETIRVRVTVVDSAGNVAFGQLGAIVGDDGAIAPLDLPPDAAPGADLSAPAKLISFGGCHVSAPGQGPSALAVLLGLGLGGLVRRARRRADRRERS